MWSCRSSFLRRWSTMLLGASRIALSHRITLYWGIGILPPFAFFFRIVHQLVSPVILPCTLPLGRATCYWNWSPLQIVVWFVVSPHWSSPEFFPASHSSLVTTFLASTLFLVEDWPLSRWITLCWGWMYLPYSGQSGYLIMMMTWLLMLSSTRWCSPQGPWGKLRYMFWFLNFLTISPHRGCRFGAGSFPITLVWRRVYWCQFCTIGS